MHNTDGFFVAKLVKYDNVIPVDKEKSEEDLAIEKALEENRKAAEEREEVIAGKKEMGKKEAGKKEMGKKESGKKETGKKEAGKEKSGKKEGEKRFGKKPKQNKPRQEKPRQEKPRQEKPRQEKPKQEKGTEGAANAKEMTPKEERKMVRNKKDGKKRFMMKQKKE